MPIVPRKHSAEIVIPHHGDFDVYLGKTDACAALGCTLPTLRKILRAARDHEIESPFVPGAAIREYATPQDLSRFMRRCARAGILPSRLQKRFAPATGKVA